jgi:hypothetical protein
MSATVDLAPIRHRLTSAGAAAVAAPGADFYTLADWAIVRTIMGEDLRRLPDRERLPWLARMVAMQDPADGSFPQYTHHSRLHGNGTAIGGIGALGGCFRHPVRLYEPFADAARATTWLDGAIDWSKQWSASHLFWGGMHCLAMSGRADAAWADTVIGWLDREADPDTGWWRRGVAHADRHQPLGGAVHILPIYQHLGRRFPHLARTVASTLALQHAGGHWLDGRADGVTYLDLDALYVFALGRRWTPEAAPAAVAAAIARHADLILADLDGHLARALAGHAHNLLCLVGILGLHRQLAPERFRDDRTWSDIFSDPALYRSAAVEPPLSRTAAG